MPKMTVLDNVIRKLARERADRLRSAYLANGVSAEELASAEAELKAELAPMFKTWKPSMRRGHKGFSGFMDEGRLKNIFEAGTTGGWYAPDDRRLLSNEYFGMRPDDSRELYGYLKRPKKYGHDDVENYGQFEIEFRPDVRRRMTVTNGDSYNNLMGNSITGKVAPGSPIVIDDPETYINWMGQSMSEFDQDPEVYNGRMMRKVLDDLKSYHRPTLGNDDYVEAQFHRPLTTKDIKSVAVPVGGSDFRNTSWLWKDRLLKRSGIDNFPVYDAFGNCIYNCR